jgi:N-acetylneuraminic acid mutarotase
MRWPNSSTTALMARLDASFGGGAKSGWTMPNGDALLYPTMRDAFKYCPATDNWERLPGSVPIGMTGHGDGVILENRYVVLAGSQEKITTRAGRSEPGRFPSEGVSQVALYHGWGDQILCFDTKNNEYSRLGLLPYGVKSSAVGGNGSHIFVVGGEPMTGLHCNAGEQHYHTLAIITHSLAIPHFQFIFY